MNIYVGNLAYSVTNEDLAQAFSAFGDVQRASVIMDKATGQSKGFGFVEMASDADGTAAIKALDGTPLKGRNMKVNEAQARPAKPQGRRF